MSKSRTAQSLLAVWRTVAADSDRSLVIPSTNSFFRRSIDDPDTLWRLIDALSLRLTDLHADYMSACGYSWVVDPDPELYHPPAEAQYQLHVLDVSATLWDACRADRRDASVFCDIMARYSRLWGGVGNTSPKARVEDGVRFVVVPFGWDDHLHLALDGLRAFAPSLLSDDRIIPIDIAAPELRPTAAIPSWNALLARALTSELGCHELLAPACIERIIRETPQLRDASQMQEVRSSLDTQLTRCSLAMLYSIAHEVGHHLSQVFPAWPNEDDEQRADRLAMTALWNCPGSARGLKSTDEPDDALSILAGAFFFIAIDIGTAAEHAVRARIRQATPYPSSLTHRLSAWLGIVEQILAGQPEVRFAGDSASALLAATHTYTEAFNRYARAVLPDAIPIARRIVEDLHLGNPNLHDLPALDRKIDSAMRAQFSEKHPNPID